MRSMNVPQWFTHTVLERASIKSESKDSLLCSGAAVSLIDCPAVMCMSTQQTSHSSFTLKCCEMKQDVDGKKYQHGISSWKLLLNPKNMIIIIRVVILLSIAAIRMCYWHYSERNSFPLFFIYLFSLSYQKLLFQRNNLS